MSWRMERVSSEDPILKKILTDENHIFNLQDEIFDIYGVEKQKLEKAWGTEYMISSWQDNKMLKDDQGRYLDIALHINKERLTWHPYIEYLIIKKEFERGEKIERIQLGYIGGETGPFEPFSEVGKGTKINSKWYQLIVDINRDKKLDVNNILDK